MLLVGVAPVLERVDDDVAVLLFDPERQQETIDAIGRRGVEVEPGFLVGDAIRILAADELGLRAAEPRQRTPVGGVEGEEAVVLLDDEGGVGDDLANRLLEPGLGEMIADDSVLVRAHGRGLEPHRVRELGADDGHQRHHQQHDQQREPAFVFDR